MHKHNPIPNLQPLLSTAVPIHLSCLSPAHAHAHSRSAFWLTEAYPTSGRPTTDTDKARIASSSKYEPPSHVFTLESTVSQKLQHVHSRQLLLLSAASHASARTKPLATLTALQWESQLLPADASTLSASVSPTPLSRIDKIDQRMLRIRGGLCSACWHPTSACRTGRRSCRGGRGRPWRPRHRTPAWWPPSTSAAPPSPSAWPAHPRSPLLHPRPFPLPACPRHRLKHSGPLIMQTWPVGQHDRT